ncbi:MAG: hypothetical protein MR992_03905 [Lachnospiraceae bacterium]|nr:hypothetical protein [Lachnospiraceae bacterium]MDD7627562.1 hypothetical protein [Lachnospiraceae bacterium]MDY4120233.1 hypothetical protein [Lachnospiraceae bacterium]
MINKLHLAMIELFSGDAKRIQHFCKVHSYAKIIAETENVDEKCLFTLEADFLVNIMEDGLSKEAALNVYHGIFKTECGKKICKEMLGIC